MEYELKEYWTNPDGIIKELEQVIKQTPAGIATYARKIGITPPTLVNILIGQKRVEFRSWCKIKAFLQKQDKGINPERLTSHGKNVHQKKFKKK